MTSVPDPTTEATPSAGAGRKLLVGAIIAGIIGGTAVGAFALGPALRPAPKAAPDSSAALATAPPANPPFVINNIVLNPANSRGTRFLLVSVGIQSAPNVDLEVVTRRETEIRDRVLHLLGAKTVDELVDIRNRDGFRREIGAALDSLLGSGKVKSVFFPQFMVQ